jgi:hypothetical protein
MKRHFGACACLIHKPCAAQLSEAELHVLDNVQKFGWHSMGIHGESSHPSHAFSIGLYHSFSHPEIVIFGPPLETLHQMVNNVGFEVHRGVRFQEGSRSRQIIDGYEVVFRTVVPDRLSEYLGWALWFYNYKQFPVLQCVYPDRDHHLPWDERTAEGFRAMQPPLWRSPARDR